MRLVSLAIAGLLTAAAGLGAWGQVSPPVFGEAAAVTNTDTESRLARSPEGSLLFGPDGRLHLAYTEKNDEGTSLGTPGTMLYRVYSDGGWSEPLPVRSNAGEGVPFNSGGNPSMALNPDGRIHFAWHDYRHSTSSSGTNQVEIYARTLLPDGQFDSDEIRLSDNTGNSWRPKIALGSGGRLIVAWYDFSESSLGDLLLAVSDGNQVFSGDRSFESQVVRAANPDGEGVLLPQIAIGADGGLRAVWTGAELEGFFFQNERVFYGEIADPSSLDLSERIELTPQGSRSTDPAKIALAGDGTVWALWTDYAGGIPNIAVARKPAGAAAFLEAMAVSDNDLPDMVGQGHMAVGPDGRLHAVWTDYRTGGGDVYYRLFDPPSGSWSDIVPLTFDDFNVDEKPAVAAAPDGRVAVVWERGTDGRRDLAMRISEGVNAAPDWALH